MKEIATSRALNRAATLLLLLLLFAQLLCAATRLSATVDEGFHITSGHEYLRTGRLHLFDEHAPVAKALFAWPLLLVPDLTPPDLAPGYESGDQIAGDQIASGLITVTQQTTLAYRPIARVIVAPRIAATLLTVVVAASVGRCAASLAGRMAGLLALALLAFDPNIFAHGSPATTEMGATAFSFWAIWAGARWVERPSGRRWWHAAFLLGAAQAAKLTALLVYPVLGIVVLGAVLVRDGRARRRLLPGFVAMVAVSVIVLWAFYGFEVRTVAGVLGGAVPLPAASHIERWLRLRENLAYGRESFLLGQNGMHGWLLYFPVAALVKTPIPLLLLGAWAGLRAVWIRVRRRRLRWAAVPAGLALFPLIYGVASLMSSLNIGYRHLLPTLPFAYVGIAAGIAPLLSGAGRRVGASRRFALAGVGALLVWLAVGTITIAPHALAFFNEIAGGPDTGWRYLADSNTDWGQTFVDLAAYQKKVGLGTVKLSAFTFYDPAAYGVAYESIAPMHGAVPVLPRRFNPEAGVYAISATTLDGVPLAYPATFDWFRHREPLTQLGHVMLLYEIEPLVGTWLAQCSVPAAPLTAESAHEGLGIDDLRLVAFDCAQSWVWPGGASRPGWYGAAIDEQTRLRWPRADQDGAELLPGWRGELGFEGLALNYVQPRDGALPAFALWACDGCHLPALAEGGASQGTARFLGFRAPAHAPAGGAIDVLTMWEVLAVPDAPLSVMLHLRDANGAQVAVGDGLGYPVEQWCAGDQFVQRHRLAIPEGVSGSYTLVTGMYRLDTLEQVCGVPSTKVLIID